LSFETAECRKLSNVGTEPLRAIKIIDGPRSEIIDGMAGA
jgi:hypothetical protein